MPRLILTFTFLICLEMAKTSRVQPNETIISLENKLELKFLEYTNSVAKWLENINDKHFNGTKLGKLLSYGVIKQKMNIIRNEARGGIHTSLLALIPIIFYVGAMSTWMVMTGIMAAKSVAIGLTLLVFKIGVSIAKMSSFFTVWKLKHHEHTFPAPVYYDHHHDTHSDIHHPHHHAEIHRPHHHADIHPNYAPDWSSLPEYKTPELEYSESKKAPSKHSY